MTTLTWIEGPPEALKPGMVVQTEFPETKRFLYGQVKEPATQTWLVGGINENGGLCDCCKAFGGVEDIKRWQWCWLLPPEYVREICEAT